MKWCSSDAAWESRHVAAEIVMGLLERGRVCQADGCAARSEMVFVVELDGKRGFAGFCVGHGPAFATAHHQIIRGLPRLLREGEVLSPPITVAETDDLEDGDADDGGEDKDGDAPDEAE